MAKLFAVYQFGWRDQTESTTPMGDGVTTPTWALIGVCRDAAMADRIARRLRRAGRRALGLGTRPREPLIGRADYDPFHYLPPARRDQFDRRAARRRALAGTAARRADLGIG